MSRNLITPLFVLASILSCGTTRAQEAVFGASLQPRIVEGEAQKPPGTFYIGGYSSPAVRRDTSFISIRSVTRLTGVRKAFPTSPFQSRVGHTKRGLELDRSNGRTVEPAPHSMA